MAVHDFIIRVVDVYEYVAGSFDFNSTELKIAEDAMIELLLGKWFSQVVKPIWPFNIQ